MAGTWDSIAQAAKQAANAAASSPQSLGTLASSGYQKLGALQSMVIEKAGVNVKALSEAGYGLPPLGPHYEEAKRRGAARLFDLGSHARAQAMFGLKCQTVAAATRDPDMPECVKARIADLVDTFWSDLTVVTEQAMSDMKRQITGELGDTVDELAAIGTPPTRCSPSWLRAFVLYRLFPFDRSIFWQIKDPFFWVFTILSLIPLYGIRVSFFAIVLALIVTGRHADEYQLVQYIIGFKGSQFISSGLLQACIAAVRYYLCVHPGGQHTCDTRGPGAQEDIVSGLTDLLGSCILTWIAFLWLPCSARCAGLRIAAKEDADADNDIEAEVGLKYNLSRGGRLGPLLFWDISAFILSCAFTFFLMYVDSSHLRPGGLPRRHVSFSEVVDDFWHWRGHSAIFFGRVFYSMLSAPFVVFVIPGLNAVLTHTTATGYNRNGVCVPFMLHPPVENKSE